MKKSSKKPQTQSSSKQGKIIVYSVVATATVTMVMGMKQITVTSNFVPPTLTSPLTATMSGLPVAHLFSDTGGNGTFFDTGTQISLNPNGAGAYTNTFAPQNAANNYKVNVAVVWVASGSINENGYTNTV